MKSFVILYDAIILSIFGLFISYVVLEYARELVYNNKSCRTSPNYCHLYQENAFA